MKQERLAILARLLQEGKITSQSDAVSALREQGLFATQATVSRNLQELGAVRSTRSGIARYELQSEHSVFGISLARVLREFVLRATTSEPMIVLHTPPGHAGMVAAALDRNEVEGILGVVAGDDTLFVCCEQRLGAAQVLKNLEALHQESS